MKHFKIKVAAQYAQDGSGKPYKSYLIPEPKSFEAYVEAKLKFNALPRSEIGASAYEPPLSPKSMDLVRGDPPIEIVVCEELLKHLKTHRKSLSIYDEQEILEERPVRR